MITTDHTCNEGNGPVRGMRTAGCPGCDERLRITFLAKDLDVARHSLDPRDAARINGLPVCLPADLRAVADTALSIAPGPGADLLDRHAVGTLWLGAADAKLMCTTLRAVADSDVARPDDRARAQSLGGVLARFSFGVPADTEQVRALYRERTHLLAVIAAHHPSVLVESAPDLPEYALLVVNASTGKVTHHINRGDLDLLPHVTRVDAGHPDARWDGADKTTTLHRLQILATAVRRLQDRVSLVVTADGPAPRPAPGAPWTWTVVDPSPDRPDPTLYLPFDVPDVEPAVEFACVDDAMDAAKERCAATGVATDGTAWREKLGGFELFVEDETRVPLPTGWEVVPSPTSLFGQWAESLAAPETALAPTPVEGMTEFELQAALVHTRAELDAYRAWAWDQDGAENGCTPPCHGARTGEPSQDCDDDCPSRTGT